MAAASEQGFWQTPTLKLKFAPPSSSRDYRSENEQKVTKRAKTGIFPV
jgi:hypothetical protein